MLKLFPWYPCIYERNMFALITQAGIIMFFSSFNLFMVQNVEECHKSFFVFVGLRSASGYNVVGSGQ